MALSLKQLHEQIGKICKDIEVPLNAMGPVLKDITRESYLETLGLPKGAHTLAQKFAEEEK